MHHQLYIHRCLQLALLGNGHTAPNPMVGAVLVHENTIIGEGYHQQYGGKHAEVECIASVKAEHQHLISVSTLYVSLEPCSHQGKTPPCTGLIIQNKIPRVVIGCGDVHDDIRGNGIQILKDAGVDVIAFVLENEAIEINKRFFVFHQQQRPYIILKWANTSNGYIAAEAGKPLAISNSITNRLVHIWRTEEQAILIGTHTAINDNPFLTNRYAKGKNPIRLVIDLQLKLSPTLNTFNADADTIVFNYHLQEQKENICYIKIDANKDTILQILQHCYQLNILSILVEGGAITAQSFIDVGYWDEARIITNTELTIPSGINAPSLPNIASFKQETFQTDTIQYFRNPHANY